MLNGGFPLSRRFICIQSEGLLLSQQHIAIDCSLELHVHPGEAKSACKWFNATCWFSLDSKLCVVMLDFFFFLVWGRGHVVFVVGGGNARWSMNAPITQCSVDESKRAACLCFSCLLASSSVLSLPLPSSPSPFSLCLVTFSRAFFSCLVLSCPFVSYPVPKLPSSSWLQHHSRLKNLLCFLVIPLHNNSARSGTRVLNSTHIGMDLAATEYVLLLTVVNKERHFIELFSDV